MRLATTFVIESNKIISNLNICILAEILLALGALQALLPAAGLLFLRAALVCDRHQQAIRCRKTPEPALVE